MAKFGVLTIANAGLEITTLGVKVKHFRIRIRIVLFCQNKHVSVGEEDLIRAPKV